MIVFITALMIEDLHHALGRTSFCLSPAGNSNPEWPSSLSSLKGHAMVNQKNTYIIKCRKVKFNGVFYLPLGKRPRWPFCHRQRNIKTTTKLTIIHVPHLSNSDI